MLVLRIYGYALAFSFCFITLMAASPRTHPSEGEFFLKQLILFLIFVTFFFFCPVILEFMIENSVQVGKLRGLFS
jgi:hypothetical protein